MKMRKTQNESASIANRSTETEFSYLLASAIDETAVAAGIHVLLLNA